MSKPAIEMNERESWLSALDISWPLYVRALFSELEDSVRAVESGEDLSRAVKGRSAEWVALSADAARKAGELADRAMQCNTADLLEIPLEGLDDFSLTTLAWVIFEHDPGAQDKALSDRLRVRNIEAHLKILYSPDCHPLVDYEWVALDFIGHYLATEDADEVDIVKRWVAHALQFGKEECVVSALRTLGSVHIESDEIEKGCRVLGELIASDPLDFENYYTAAVDLSNLRHYDLALKVAERAGHMLRITKTRCEAADDLMMYAKGWQRQLHSDQAIVDKPAERPLRKALEIGFMRGAHYPTIDLVRRIIPEIDSIPTKTAVL